MSGLTMVRLLLLINFVFTECQQIEVEESQEGLFNTDIYNALYEDVSTEITPFEDTLQPNITPSVNIERVEGNKHLFDNDSQPELLTSAQTEVPDANSSVPTTDSNDTSTKTEHLLTVNWISEDEKNNDSFTTEHFYNETDEISTHDEIKSTTFNKSVFLDPDENLPSEKTKENPKFDDLTSVESIFENYTDDFISTGDANTFEDVDDIFTSDYSTDAFSTFSTINSVDFHKFIVSKQEKDTTNTVVTEIDRATPTIHEENTITGIPMFWNDFDSVVDSTTRNADIIDRNYEDEIINEAIDESKLNAFQKVHETTTKYDENAENDSNSQFWLEESDFPESSLEESKASGGVGYDFNFISSETTTQVEVEGISTVIQENKEDAMHFTNKYEETATKVNNPEEGDNNLKYFEEIKEEIGINKKYETNYDFILDDVTETTTSKYLLYEVETTPTPLEVAAISSSEVEVTEGHEESDTLMPVMESNGSEDIGGVDHYDSKLDSSETTTQADKNVEAVEASILTLKHLTGPVYFTTQYEDMTQETTETDNLEASEKNDQNSIHDEENEDEILKSAQDLEEVKYYFINPQIKTDNDVATTTTADETTTNYFAENSSPAIVKTQDEEIATTQNTIKEFSTLEYLELSHTNEDVTSLSEFGISSAGINAQSTLKEFAQIEVSQSPTETTTYYEESATTSSLGVVRPQKYEETVEIKEVPTSDYLELLQNRATSDVVPSLPELEIYEHSTIKELMQSQSSTETETYSSYVEEVTTEVPLYMKFFRKVLLNKAAATIISYPILTSEENTTEIYNKEEVTVRINGEQLEFTTNSVINETDSNVHKNAGKKELVESNVIENSLLETANTSSKQNYGTVFGEISKRIFKQYIDVTTTEQSGLKRNTNDNYIILEDNQIMHKRKNEGEMNDWEEEKDLSQNDLQNSTPVTSAPINISEHSTLRTSSSESVNENVGLRNRKFDLDKMKLEAKGYSRDFLDNIYAEYFSRSKITVAEERERHIDNSDVIPHPFVSIERYCDGSTGSSCAISGSLSIIVTIDTIKMYLPAKSRVYGSCSGTSQIIRITWDTDKRLNAEDHTLTLSFLVGNESNFINAFLLVVNLPDLPEIRMSKFGVEILKTKVKEPMQGTITINDARGIELQLQDVNLVTTNVSNNCVAKPLPKTKFHRHHHRFGSSSPKEEDSISSEGVLIIVGICVTLVLVLAVGLFLFYKLRVRSLVYKMTT